MSVRVVQPADGTEFVAFAYGDGYEHLARGQILDVEPGSDIEAAVGLQNLTPLAGQQLASAANGGVGCGVSN